MEDLNRMTKAEEELITPVIDIQVIFEDIEDSERIYYTSDSDVDTKGIERRIIAAKKLKEKYLTILN